VKSEVMSFKSRANAEGRLMSGLSKSSIAYTLLVFFVWQQKVPVASVMALETQQKLAATPLPTRATQLQALQEKHFDILVIGGGATGCGVALDAASRGI